MKFNCAQCNILCNKFVKRNTNNRYFCSRSCAATYTNKRQPKRKPEGKCKLCQTAIKTSHTYCSKCKNTKFPIGGRDITLKEAIYYNHHKSSAFALVRSRARRIAKKLKLDTCQQCGYKKHIEIAHKKPISEFDENTLLSVINDPSNLIPLCPNHHWEHDHP